MDMTLTKTCMFSGLSCPTKLQEGDDGFNIYVVSTEVRNTECVPRASRAYSLEILHVHIFQENMFQS